MTAVENLKLVCKIKTSATLKFKKNLNCLDEREK
jgi:hypothetical protein